MVPDRFPFPTPTPTPPSLPCVAAPSFFVSPSGRPILTTGLHYIEPRAPAPLDGDRTSSSTSASVPTSDMSSNNNGSGFGTAATYQSIIIALVAGGILATGIVSIIWRRRRYREIERALHDATIRGTRTRRKGGKELGKMPGIWDVVVGQGGDESESEGGRGKRIEEQERHGRNGARREEGEADVSGAMAEGWNVSRPEALHCPCSCSSPHPSHWSRNQVQPPSHIPNLPTTSTRPPSRL